MERMKHGVVTLILGLLFSAPLTSNAVEGYVPAKPKNEVEPNYPIDRFANGSEISTDDGQIEVRFVVEKDGSVSAPMVVRTSMTKFLEPTLLALSKTTYEPATLDGEPVASTVSKTFFYSVSASDLNNVRGSRTSFGNTRDNGVPDGYQSFYDQFTEEMESESPAEQKVAHLLDKMVELKHQSSYSLAYHSLARYRFAEKFQGGEEKIAALKDLIWFDPQVKEKFQILQGDLKDAIWTSLLKEQIQAGQYAEALETYAAFSKVRAGAEMPFADAIAQITALKENDQVVQRAVLIPESGFTQLPLLKNSFTFFDVEGSITGLTLRCDTRFTELSYQADAQYDIPEKWGNCNLQIAGEAGTKSQMLLQ